MDTARKPAVRALLLVLCLLLLAGSASAARYQTLRPGESGEGIRNMQAALRHLGYRLDLDGDYGPQTQATVLAFQLKERLEADGLAGHLTLSRLFALAPQFAPGMNLESQLPQQTQQPSLPSPVGSMYVYTSNGKALNLRGQARHGFNVISTIPNGSRVDVLSVSGTWTQVSYQGRQGYVQSQFLRQNSSEPQTLPTQTPGPLPQPTAEVQTPASSIAYVSTPNGGRINLRSRAGRGGTAIGTLANGSKVAVIARLGEWTQVSHQGRSAYVMDSYLRHEGQTVPKPTASPAPAPAPTAQADQGNGQQAQVITSPGSSLNLRSEPSGGKNIIGKVPSGAVLIVLDRGSSYSLVVYAGQSGYVANSYLRFLVGTGSTPSPENTPSPSLVPQETQPPGAEQTFSRTLRLGMKGSDVQLLQQKLLALSYVVSLTGEYDSMTLEAVKAFQKANFIAADGVFGSQSATVLLSPQAIPAPSQAPETITPPPDLPESSYSTLKVDNSSAAVKTMQQGLMDLGYPLRTTGNFDMATHQAVVAFQQRNGLPITGIANPRTQAVIFSGQARPYSTPVSELGADEGKVGGPATSQVQLLHWFNDVKKVSSSGQRVTVYHPGSGISFTLRFYSMGQHADSEPLSFRDTQLMNRAFGAPSWNIQPVYVKLNDGRWTLATMHNRPHLNGSIQENGFGGHLCVHFLRDTDEVNRNSPDYGASNQRSLRKAWKSMTGIDVP